MSIRVLSFVMLILHGILFSKHCACIEFIECTMHEFPRCDAHKKPKEHTADLSMLIIIHRLRTIFYYLPFFPSPNAFIAKCVLCASLQEWKDTFSDYKSYEMFIMSLCVFSTFFMRSHSKRKQTLRKNGVFLFNSIELHNVQDVESRGHKIYRPRPAEERIKMQIHAFSLWHLDPRRMLWKRVESGWGRQKYPSQGTVLCAFAL